MDYGYYGAGYGYAYDDGGVGDFLEGDMSHTHFVVWLIVITLAAVVVLGGLKVYGFHFVVRT
jgi:hypothetical protein